MEHLDQDGQGIHNSIDSRKLPEAKIKIEKTEIIKPVKKEHKAESNILLMPGKISAYYDRAQYPKMQGLADSHEIEDIKVHDQDNPQKQKKVYKRPIPWRGYSKKINFKT